MPQGRRYWIPLLGSLRRSMERDHLSCLDREVLIFGSTRDMVFKPWKASSVLLIMGPTMEALCPFLPNNVEPAYFMLLVGVLHALENLPIHT